jgi:hypothetical protein
MSFDTPDLYSRFENFDDKWEACTLCGSTHGLWPHNEMIRRDGKLYCYKHYVFRFEKRDREKWTPRYNDDQKKPI